MTATENVDLRSQGAGSMETMQPGDGWLYFAGTVMGLAGLMRLVDSLWAFRYNGNLPDGLQDGVLGDNIKTYAWLWLAVGRYEPLGRRAVAPHGDDVRQGQRGDSLSLPPGYAEHPQ